MQSHTHTVVQGVGGGGGLDEFLIICCSILKQCCLQWDSMRQFIYVEV